jgi:di/tricarboxylate transporter
MEAVISNSCPIVGTSIRASRFRSRYNVAVIAVSRNGSRLRQKIGDIHLQPGDTLLLEGDSAFVEYYRNSPDFFLVSFLEQSPIPRHERSMIALSIMFGMILTVTLGWLSMCKRPCWQPV